MTTLTWLVIIGGLLLLAAGGWLMGRFLLHLLKHAVIAALIGAALMAVWYYQARPPRDPNVGKRAYLIRDNRYLGEVVRSAKDDRLGEVWVVRQPDGYEAKFAKSRVTLRDK